MTPDHLVEIELNGFRENVDPVVVKEAFKSNPNVISATICVGGISGRWARSIVHHGVETELGYYQVDAEFVPTLGIQLLEGTNFPEYLSNDSSYLIACESAARFFDITERDGGHDIPIPGKIVGIARDFHYASLETKLSPTFLQYSASKTIGRMSRVILRLHRVDEEAIGSLAEIWKGRPTNYPMEYTILSERHRAMYSDRFKDQKLISTISIAVALITCFGIAGFSFFFSRSRLRQMAIRKVVGASQHDLYKLWLKELIPGFLIAIIVSTPSCLYFIQRWTDTLVYKQQATDSTDCPGDFVCYRRGGDFTDLTFQCTACCAAKPRHGSPLRIVKAHRVVAGLVSRFRTVLRPPLSVRILAAKVRPSQKIVRKIGFHPRGATLIFTCISYFLFRERRQFAIAIDAFFVLFQSRGF